jgi:hypothetical protein
MTRTVHALLLSAALVFASWTAYGQEPPAAPESPGLQALRAFQQDRIHTNTTAMLVLGSWAAGNILAGAYGNFRASGEAKYFHQFNALWNSVNLGIAVFGYLDAVSADPATMSAAAIIRDHSSLQSFLLLNAGLDVAYMTAGFYLRERAKNSSNAGRLRGYGTSLLLQGGFLLLFDVTLYFIHAELASTGLFPYLDGQGGGGIALRLGI